ncbi:Tyrosine recombinase XerC [subsurface metagenome]
METTRRLVSDYLVYCQANGASLGTLVLKTSILGRFAQANPELPLQPEPIFQFLATLGKSMATRTGGRKHIRAFYTFACQKHDLIDPMPQVSVPLRAAKGPRRPRQSSAPLMHMGGGGHRTEVLTPSPSPAPVAELLSTSEAIEAFRTSHRKWKDQTAKWYENTFIPFAAEFEYMPQTEEPLEEFIYSPDTELKQFTRFRAVRTLYNWLEKRKDHPNPMKKLDPPSSDTKPVIPLDDQEIGRLLSAVASDQEQGIIHTLLTTGIRPGELRNLKPESIMEDTIVLDGKTGIDRMPVKPDVKDLLLRISGPNYVFENRDGKPYTQVKLYETLGNIMLRANVREGKGGARIFRHTFVTRIYDQTGDPFLAQRLARHATLRMTKHYEHSAMRSTIQKYQDLDFLPPAPGPKKEGDPPRVVKKQVGQGPPTIRGSVPFEKPCENCIYNESCAGMWTYALEGDILVCDEGKARDQGEDPAVPQGEAPAVPQGEAQDPNVIQFSETPIPPYIIKEYAYRLHGQGTGRVYPERCWRIVGANGIWWPTTGDHHNFFSFEEAQEKLRELSEEVKHGIKEVKHGIKRDQKSGRK